MKKGIYSPKGNRTDFARGFHTGLVDVPSQVLSERYVRELRERNEQSLFTEQGLKGRFYGRLSGLALGLALIAAATTGVYTTINKPLKERIGTIQVENKTNYSLTKIRHDGTKTLSEKTQVYSKPSTNHYTH